MCAVPFRSPKYISILTGLHFIWTGTIALGIDPRLVELREQYLNERAEMPISDEPTEVEDGFELVSDFKTFAHQQTTSGSDDWFLSGPGKVESQIETCITQVFHNAATKHLKLSYDPQDNTINSVWEYELPEIANIQHICNIDVGSEKISVKQHILTYLGKVDSGTFGIVTAFNYESGEIGKRELVVKVPKFELQDQSKASEKRTFFDKFLTQFTKKTPLVDPGKRHLGRFHRFPEFYGTTRIKNSGYNIEIQVMERGQKLIVKKEATLLTLVQLTSEYLEGLEFLATKHVDGFPQIIWVHGDIKPANMGLSTDGAGMFFDVDDMGDLISATTRKYADPKYVQYIFLLNELKKYKSTEKVQLEIEKLISHIEHKRSEAAAKHTVESGREMAKLMEMKRFLTESLSSLEDLQLISSKFDIYSLGLSLDEVFKQCEIYKTPAGDPLRKLFLQMSDLDYKYRPGLSKIKVELAKIKEKATAPAAAAAPAAPAPGLKSIFKRFFGTSN